MLASALGLALLAPQAAECGLKHHQRAVIVGQSPVYAAPAATTYAAPAAPAVYSAPAATTYAAPAPVYAAPTATYAAPTATYAAPTATYAAPTATYAAPTTYAAPAPVYSAPTYAAPTTLVAAAPAVGSAPGVSSDVRLSQTLLDALTEDLISFYNSSESGATRIEKIQALRNQARENYTSLLGDAVEDAEPNAAEQKKIDSMVDYVVRLESDEDYVTDYYPQSRRLLPRTYPQHYSYPYPYPYAAPQPVLMLQPLAQPVVPGVLLVPQPAKHKHHRLKY